MTKQAYFAEATKVTCVQCSKTFQLTAMDKELLALMEMPEPTHCPDCRLQRRLAWRNERALYTRTCDKCKTTMLAIYPAGSVYTVYCETCYWNDDWSAADYGRDIDWNRPFFEQFSELLRAVPHAAAYNDQPDHSEYINYCYQVKNTYLTFGSNWCEDTLYGYNLISSKNCVDCLNSHHLELCSSCIDCFDCYNTHHSQECSNMRDSYFCYDSRGSHDCFGSSGLRNTAYVFFNEQLTPEAYQAKVADYLQRYSPEKLEQMALEVRYTVPQRPAMILNCEDTTGNHLEHCNQSHSSFDSEGLEHSRYCIHITGKGFDCLDCYGGGNGMQRCYEHVTGVGQNQHFCILCWKDTSNLDYCIATQYGHDNFGCASLRRANFSILNKTYSEAEYHQLRAKLIEHMKRTGEWGEFFPIKDSMFSYNETVAMMHFPLTKPMADANGWRWSPDVQKTTGQTTANIKNIPRFAQKVDEVITTKVFECTTCQRNFKITPMELKFYKAQRVWIPRECYECRFQRMLKKRTGYTLWHRQCMCTQPNHGTHHGRCTNEFETTWFPERKELVYCEHCYKKEIL